MTNTRSDLLDAHRLVDARLTTVRLRYPRHVGYNSQRGPHGTGPETQVRIVYTDQGAVGWGISGLDDKTAQERWAALKGRRVSELFDPARGVIDPLAAHLDIPLHDLAGQILNQPVHALLGEQKMPAPPCYSGMIYFDDLDPKQQPAGLDQIVANCRQDYEFGYRQFKIKIGRGHRWMESEAGLRRDIEVTRLVAREFPDCDLLVDGNDGFTPETLFRFLDGIGDVKLFWIEEPFPEKREDLLKLRQWLEARGLKPLIADGETGPFQQDWLLSLADEGLVDVLLPDVIGLGFTGWRQLMPLLTSRSIQASPHNWGSQLKTYYTAHLAAGLGNIVTIEGVTCFSDDVDFGEYRMLNGRLVCSNEPGFGMKLLRNV